MPHIYAAQVAYMSQNLNYRENVILSLHTHNDRGCGVADTEMGLLAGADRVEGTLFGNGERTGNVDLITVAMNMLMLGVDPHLDFSDLPRICELYERITDMSVPSPSAPIQAVWYLRLFPDPIRMPLPKGSKTARKTIQHSGIFPILP